MLIDGVRTEFEFHIPSWTGSVAVAAMVVVLDQEVLHWTASLV
jgi:hypothetical protein